MAVLHTQLHAVAVELDLVHPGLAGGRAADALAKLRVNERQHLGMFARFLSQWAAWQRARH